MSNAVAARQALKAAGFNARQVTVKRSSGIVSSSLYFTIRERGVPFAAVEDIANRFRWVDYCVASGEALLGGAYVWVSISDDLKRELARPIEAQLEAMTEGATATIEGQRVRRADRYDYLVGGNFYCHARSAAEQIAKLAYFGTPEKKCVEVLDADII